MGCGGSTPTADEQQKQQEAGSAQAGKQATATDVPKDAGDDGKAAKAATTRARRLSYVTADANGQAAVGVGGEAKPGGPAAPVEGANGPQAPNSTRARRLSYVTNDPNGVPIPVEEGADDGADEGPEAQALPAAVPGTGAKASLGLSVACMSRAGREPGFKKTNQDNCFAFEKYISEDQSLFGAMDGHGPHGHLVSGYVKQHLPIILVNHLTVEKDVKKALSAGFCEVDKSLGNSRIDCEFSGSTCVVSFLKGRTLTTAWVGDSRGVLGREIAMGVYEAHDLTEDHKPTMPEEKARILRSNGRVERLVDELGQPMGPHRVWLQYAWIPGLAMSRALGDVLAHQVGVSSEPDHTVVEIGEKDRFIVLASDGVWEFITSQEAVDIISQFDSAEEGCRQLVDEAYQRWLTEEEGVVDDITAVVIKFIQ